MQASPTSGAAPRAPLWVGRKEASERRASTCDKEREGKPYSRSAKLCSETQAKQSDCVRGEWTGNCVLKVDFSIEKLTNKQKLIILLLSLAWSLCSLTGSLVPTFFLLGRFLPRAYEVTSGPVVLNAM